MRIADVPRVPPGSVLLRVVADDASWIERVPPVPTGHVVPVTVDGPALARVPVDELVARGYRIRATVPAPMDGHGAVDLLVLPRLRSEHPGWWADACAAADRLFDLELGPVRLLFTPTLREHVHDLVPA
jgi:hypothetical protein